jgi:tetratricopeptide (TPR) repeat protein
LEIINIMIKVRTCQKCAQPGTEPQSPTFQTRGWLGLARLTFAFTLVTTLSGHGLAGFAAESSLDSPSLLRDRALQNALKHSKQPEDIDRALNLYKGAIDRSVKEYGADSPYTAQLYFELGCYALDNSRFMVALESLNRAVELDPNAVAPRLKLVRLHELCRRPNAAREQLVLLLKKHPDSKEGRQLLVNEIQRVDPAAAARQAFGIDKLVVATAIPPTDTGNYPAPAAKRETPPDTMDNTATPNPASGHAATPTPQAKPQANAPVPQANALVSPVQALSPVMSLRTLQKPAATAQPKRPPQEETAKITPVEPPQKAANAAKLTAPKAKPEKPAQSEVKAIHKSRKSKSKAASGENAELSSEHKKGESASTGKKAKAEKLAHAGSSKISGKGLKGLVPPPPPLPFMPVFPGIMPPQQVHPQSGEASVQLKTDAKIKAAKKANKPPESEARGEAAATKSEAKAETKSEGKSEAKSEAPKASPSKPAPEDEDFMLKWAGVNEKKKKKE